jgi:hypothetical protein
MKVTLYLVDAVQSHFHGLPGWSEMEIRGSEKGSHFRSGQFLLLPNGAGRLFAVIVFVAAPE